MAKLVLIKHSHPQVLPDVPTRQWKLSLAGRDHCAPLADRLAPHQPALVITSDEVKAVETGQIVAEKLGLRVETARDLHEHDRSNVPHMRTRDFIAAMAQFFQEPGRRVLGRESADQARARVLRAVSDAVARHPDANLAIVSHGTVIALLAAHYARIEPFQLWRQMQLPSFLVFSLPDCQLLETVDRVVETAEPRR